MLPQITSLQPSALESRDYETPRSNRDPVRRILAIEAEELRRNLWPYVFQADKADPRNRFAAMQLRSKSLGQKALDRLRIGLEIYKYPSLNNSC